MDWVYCSCAGTHVPGCPNAAGGLPPLGDDEDE